MCFSRLEHHIHVGGQQTSVLCNTGPVWDILMDALTRPKLQHLPDVTNSADLHFETFMAYDALKMRNKRPFYGPDFLKCHRRKLTGEANFLSVAAERQQMFQC